MPLDDRGARERDLEVVAAGLGRLERGVRRLAVQLRIDVAAAGQHQAVDAREDLFGRLAADQHFDRLAAGPAHGLEVVLHLAVLRDRNQGHVPSASYIRAGTATPIKSSTRVNCWRQYATAAARHRRTSARSSLTTDCAGSGRTR